jgi:hypothetical protein
MNNNNNNKKKKKREKKGHPQHDFEGGEGVGLRIDNICGNLLPVTVLNRGAKTNHNFFP